MSAYVTACFSTSTYEHADLGGSNITTSAPTAPADGVSAVLVNVSVRRADGKALPNVQVVVNADNCNVTQPAHPTDANGQVAAQISSRNLGPHKITAQLNVDGFTGMLPIDAQVIFTTPDANATLPPHVAGQAGAVPINAQVNGTPFSGTVIIQTTDPNAVLPSDVTMAPEYGGIRTLVGAVTLYTAGPQTIWVIDATTGAILQTIHVVIAAGAPTQLQVTAPTALTAGESASLTVTGVDAYGNINPNYTAALVASSSDSQATFPSTNVSAPGPLPFVLRTAGVQSVVVHDASSAAINGTATITVSPANTASVVVTDVVDTVVAGQDFNVTLRALDAFGNGVPTYAGQPVLSSSDANATLPPPHTFVPADGGVYTAGVILRTAGTQRMVVTAGPWTAVVSVSVLPAAAAALALQPVLGNSVIAGQAMSLVVTALDAYGNVASTFLDTVSFSSSDPQAVLPYDYAFAFSDAGTHLLNGAAVLSTMGSQTITVFANSSDVTAATATFLVQPGSATRLGLTLDATSTAGTPMAVQVSALDAAGNVSTSFIGTVFFASTDSNAVLPAAYTFNAGDNGTHLFVDGLTLRTPGNQTVGVSDAQSRVFGAAASVNVVPGAPSKVVFSGLPSSVAGGVPTSLTVTVTDTVGNRLTNYAGTLHFTSDDSQATLPSDTPLGPSDAGTVTLVNRVILRTGGLTHITAYDLQNPNITGTSQAIGVTGGTSSLHLQVSPAQTTVTAGQGQNCTVSALDTNNVVHTGYTGTVTLTTSDAAGVVPGSYTFTPSDAGVHTFAGVTFKTAGTQTITALDTANTSINGISGGIAVNPNVATHLSILNAPANTAANTPFSVQVQARDAFNNTATGYTGTVQASSDDSAATLPGNTAFSAGDNGVHTFSVTLNTVGQHSLTWTDTTTPSITAPAASITVNAGAPITVNLSVPGSSVAGSAFGVTLSVRDAAGNVATAYTGTVRLTSSDAQATVPVSYTFTSSDGGVVTLNSAFTLRTAGNQTLTATDTADHVITGTSANIAVQPAVAAGLLLSGVPSTLAAGSSMGAVTVAAADAYGNVATGYTGTVQWVSTDGQAVLPANYTFTMLDAGTHTFSSSVILKTSGLQTVGVADTLASAAGATSGYVSVSAGAGSSFALSYASSTNAGTAFNITAMALDAYGNSAPSYRGTAHLTSSDAQAVLPANHTFTATDNGTYIFTGAVLKTAGAQTLSATDTSNGSITGTGMPVTINATTAVSLAISGLPSSTAAGQTLGMTVTAHDTYGNTVPSYSGTVHTTCGDAQAVLPANYTFTAGDGGAHTFPASVTLKTMGVQTVTVTDTVTATLKGTASLTVTAGAANSLVLSGLASSTVAGVSQSATVTIKDAYNNTVTGYTGTVQLQSTDTAATMPTAHTYAGGDAGVYTFTGMVLKTAAVQSITPQGSAGITGTAGNITVSPAAASTLTAVSSTTSTAGSSVSLAVTALDPYNNLVKGYTGTVKVTSSDGAAVLPANHTFVGTDNGAYTFTGAVLKTSGLRTLVATDTSNGAITGQAAITVSAASASSMSVAASPTSATAGQSITMTVTVHDTYGNIATGYTGTVHFSSSDTQAVLPSDAPFATSDQGVRTLSGLSMHTAGTQWVTGTDTVTSTLTGTQSGLTITNAAVSSLVMSGIVGGVAGTAQTAVLRAQDVYGNSVGSYRGVVQFQTSDAQGVVPGNYTFTSTDNGTHTFTSGVTLKTVAAAAWVTATDTATTSINARVANLGITPATAASLSVTGIAGGTAGTALNVTVTAYDAYANVATGYTGAIAFTSSDSAGTVPPNYTFSSGTHTFTGGVTLKTAGAQSVTATDTVHGAITGTQAGIGVNPASVSKFCVAGFPTPATAGNSNNVTVAACDAYANVVPTYAGTVTLTSSDAAAGLPSNYTFNTGDNGVHALAVILKTAGTQSITATSGAVSGAQSSISVVAAAAATVAVTGYPSTATAGQVGSLTLTFRDAYNNLATGYNGTVTFTSSDTYASLPANTNLTPSTGTYFLSNQVTLKTAGSQTITVTDTANSALAGTQSGITINPGSATTLRVRPVPMAPSVLVGQLQTLMVYVTDNFNNTATSYTGTVHASCTDSAATLPSDYTFTSSDAGLKMMINGFALGTANNFVLTVTDSAHSLSGTYNVRGLSHIVTSAFGHSCELTSAGALHCWGMNWAGQLGLGDTANRGDGPNEMGSNLPAINLGTSRTVKQLMSGMYWNCAILDNNQTKCWGQNDAGQLGMGDTASRGDNSGEMGDSLPAVSLGTGVYARSLSSNGMAHVCAILSNNTLKCWGTNDNAQLGLGDNTNRGDTSGEMGSSLPTVSLGTGRSPIQMSNSYFHSCIMLDNAQVKCWGASDLGTGTGNEYGNVPGTMGDNLPFINLGQNRRVTAVSGGGYHSCALLENGQVKCWGSNGNGQLGLGDTTNRGGSPAQMGDGLPAVNFGTNRTALQLSVRGNTSCVVMDNHLVKCWGENDEGELGIGDTLDRGSAPGQMGDVLPTINLGTNRTVLSLNDGFDAFCAILDNNTIKCWGFNSNGQLGLGDTTTRGRYTTDMGDNLPTVNP